MKKVTTEELVSRIVEGMREKKAKRIVLVNLQKLEAACEYFVICQGNSTTQTSTIALSVRDMVRETLQERPFAIDGMQNGTWIAIDYGSVIVHVFCQEERAFYDIEHLWADAELKEFPDLD